MAIGNIDYKIFKPYRIIKMLPIRKHFYTIDVI